MKRSTGYQLGFMGFALIAATLLSVDVMACPGGRRQGPPPEAINACEGATENQACQFEAPHGTVSGTCRNINNQIACAPEGGPPRGNRNQAPDEA